MAYTVHPYNRAAAVAYAHQWAFGRNPRYGDFTEMGGDCSNFISQCLLAGGAVMNTDRDTGWYYHSMGARAAGWSGVPFLFKFLTTNRGRGPFGHVVPLEQVQLGDIIQLKFAGKPDFSHSLLVVDAGDGTPETIRITCHSYDSDDRPLNTYSYVSARAIHIDGIRK